MSEVYRLAGFVIPAIIAFFSWSHAETVDRLLYATGIGLLWGIPIAGIISGADDEWRKNASIDQKVNLLVSIILFPILYHLIKDFYYEHGHYGRAEITLSSVIIALLLMGVIWRAIEWIIKLFQR